ncbi:hypothetical protein GO986_16590 [Deinococcus sp. HMF7620]|uniref:Lipoprotein n=1 Tax=Deinococcus arboris TaxID=2682977 RepID=A0A7C9M859_9DEIO|nr:hypothetical protein [Deinococcus arboris]MVN88365.1 hypothetical protein [Deinococcus arboris]
MQKTTLLAASLLALSLSACTAIQRGEQFDFPLEQTDALSPVKVQPGRTMFVQVPYSRSIFEDDNELDTYFDGIDLNFNSVRGPNDKVPNAYRDASWLKLTAVDAPTGISVVLIKAEIGRIVNNTKVVGDSVNVRYSEQFRLTYKVSVDASYTPESLSPEAANWLRDSEMSRELKEMLSGDLAYVRLSFMADKKPQRAYITVATSETKATK